MQGLNPKKPHERFCCTQLLSHRLETLHGKLAEVPALRKRVLPAVSDMELRTPLAGAAGATARTLLEQPIEYAKVKH